MLKRYIYTPVLSLHSRISVALCKYFNGNIKVDIRKKFGKDKLKIKLVNKIQTLGAVFLLDMRYEFNNKLPSSQCQERKTLMYVY